MALLRKLFNKKPQDGLLEIAERVFAFDYCFNSDAMEDNEFKVYIEGIVGQLHDGFPEASYMVFEFREGNTQTLIGDILSKYDMTVVDYPRHYGRCPLLSLETIYHFLKSSESWLSVGEHNVLLMNCERGGWPVLAFVLSAFVLYMKHHNGEQKTLDMIYKQGPSDLLPLISPLNPIPSQIRYLQYVSRRNVGMQWPPPDRQLLLDCVILRVIPLFDRAGGCRPIFKVYGQDPKVVANRTPKVLFSTPKKGKLVRHYKQADCPLVKIDIRCHVQGDVVVECINLDDDLEREEMIFRAMFNTAFIRSNILMLNRDDIDMFWHCKDRFAKEFRAEILFSEMDAAISPISNKIHGTEEKGLPMEAFARVQEFFSNVDWLDTKTEIALDVLQQIAQSTILQEKLETGSSISVETGNVLLKLVPENFQEKKGLGATESRSPSKMAELKQSTPALKLSIDVKDSEPKEQVQPAQPKIISQRTPQTAVSPPVPNSNSCQSAPAPLGITTVLHDHGASNSEEAAHLVTSSSSSPSSQSKSLRSVPGTTEGSTPTPIISVSINSPPSLHAPVEDPTGLEKTSKTSSSTTPDVNSSLTTPLPRPPRPTPGKPPSSGSATPRPPSSSKKPPPSGHADSSSTPPPPVPSDSSQSAPSKPSPMLMKSISISGPTPPPPPPLARSVSGRVADPAPSPPPPPALSRTSSSRVDPPPPPPPALSRATSSRIDPPPPPPPALSRATSSRIDPPPPPPPALSRPTSSRIDPPPPPPPSLSRATSSRIDPPPPPPSLSRATSSRIDPPPPPPGLSRTSSAGGPPPPPPSRMGSMSNGKGPPGPPGPPSGPLLSRGRNISRAPSSNGAPRTNLKPYHWLKLTRAAQGSLWDETQKSDESSMPPEIDLSELERLFAVASPKGKAKGGKGAGAAPPKPEKVQLIDLRRAYNCEIMLSKVKIPLPELVNAVLAMDDSTLDIDQVDNLIKFCPTKEEMETLKNYTGNKENLGKCEQFFLELMKVPRIEAKLRVFSFKIQFTVQASDLRTNLNIVNSAADEIRNSTKLKRVMQTILSLGNALNHGTARGSAIGFRLDSLLKLTDTRARNNKMTLMHYLCKVISEKLPEILEFPKDLVSLEAATKLQLKFLAEEMQAISKGLEKVEQELTGASNDGPVSAKFCKLLREFLGFAEADVRSLTSIYSVVGRNADALALYFGEDPARCPFEQVVSTLLIFARMFTRAHTENIKQIELDKKKAEKDALNEKKQKEAEQIEIMKKQKEAKQSEAMKKQKEEAEQSEAMKENEAEQSEAMKKEKEVEQSEAMKKEKEEAKQSEVMKKEKESEQSAAMKKEKESEQSETMKSKMETEQCMQIPMIN